MNADAPWQYGDLLQFTAKPATPSENNDFSYRDYLAKYNIHTVIYHPWRVTRVGSDYGDTLRKGLIAFRERARQSIFEVFPQPEAGLLSGILLGLDNDLPPSLAQAYRDTGVAYIIAISGFNLAILAGLFLLIFTRLVGPYWAALAAQFATLPFIATHFGRISLSALLANPLVLPFQPAVMIRGALTTLAGMLHPLAGKVLMFFSWPFLKYTNFMVALLVKIKGGVLTIHPVFTVWIFVLFGLIVALFFLREKLARFFQSGSFIWVILLLGTASVSIWSIAASQPDGQLHLHLVRCGDKATLYMTTPTGKTLAIDPRDSMDEFTSSLEKKPPPGLFTSIPC
jgi:predicted membrane metal-binding protein